MKKITLLMLIIFTMSIQAQNKLLSSINEQYYNSTWNKSSGTNYEYDSNNNLITETYANYDNVTNKWTISYKYNYTYNASNKVSEELSQDWNSTTNVLENSEKSTYTYTSGKLTEMLYYEWLNSKWVLSGKEVITYNSNNLPATILWYNWDGSQWVNDESNTFTYNANNKIIADLFEEWIGAQWVNSEKTLYTYNANNKMISNKRADWDEFNTIWVENGDKTEYEWDTTGNKTRETDYYKYSDGSLGQWKEEYTYDTFNLMSSFAHPFKDQTGFDYIFEDFPHVNKVQGYNSYSYNQSTSSYNLSSRTTYNYNSSITLGTKEPEIADEKITVFPNPIEDFITIQNESNTTIDIAVITDMTGKVLQQSQNANKIDVQSLPKGMYLLQVSVGDNKETRKFIKK